MREPIVLECTFKLQCHCGNEHRFDLVDDGAQHIRRCPCGRYLSIQIDDPILQFLDRVSP